MTGRTVQRRPSSHALRIPSTTNPQRHQPSTASPTPLTGTAYPTVIVTLLLTIFGWSFIDSCAV